MATLHIPVLRDEVLSQLNAGPGRDYIDGTVGGGGHAAAILEATAPDGRLIGLDADPQALVHAGERLQQFGNRVILKNKNYKQIDNIINDLPDSFSVRGILLDLGLSSDQLDQSGRGFSFADAGSLDMRFDPTTGLTADEILRTASEQELGRIFRDYGEISQWKKLARTFHSRQRSDSWTVPEVVDTILAVIPRRGSRIHPATKVFQALRIAVNHELDTIAEFLERALASAPVGTRIAIISFHSLEDKIVKHFFQKYSRPDYGPKESPLMTELRPARLKIITKKAISATEAEQRQNPRSRSAKLRVAEII